MNLKLLGCIPQYEQLATPSLSQVFNEINGLWLNHVTQPHNNKVRKVIIGAKAAEGIMDELEEGTLIITPSDRINIIQWNLF